MSTFDDKKDSKKRWIQLLYQLKPCLVLPHPQTHAIALVIDAFTPVIS